MKETTRKLLPGRLMLVAACLLFIGAALGSGRRGVFVVLGAMFLCIGAGLLRQARRKP